MAQFSMLCYNTQLSSSLYSLNRNQSDFIYFNFVSVANFMVDTFSYGHPVTSVPFCHVILVLQLTAHTKTDASKSVILPFTHE